MGMKHRISVIPRGIFRGKYIKPILMCQKMQFLEWPLESGSKGKSFPVDPHVKITTFTAEIRSLL